MFEKLIIAVCATALLIGSSMSANAAQGYYDPETRMFVEVKKATISRSRKVKARFVRKEVSYKTNHKIGTIIVDRDDYYLYLVTAKGKAMRYGVGLGREGFGWGGQVKIRRKAEWPGWTPPAAMRKRQPELPRFMKGGKDNPLGARALYLYKGGRDTLYRIHGTNAPWTIGSNVSSGCIRLVNEDVIDLYNRVKMGVKVIVL